MTLILTMTAIERVMISVAIITVIYYQWLQNTVNHNNAYLNKTIATQRPIGSPNTGLIITPKFMCHDFKFVAIFTPGQFGPLGIVVACVCPCVRQSWACLCDNSSQVRAWITKFGPKNAKYFAQGPYCFWDWLGLTFQVKFYFIEKSCLFASLLHLWNIC